MTLRERLQALRSRRTSTKTPMLPQISIKSTTPTGTPTKKSRLHSVAARRQWHHQQLQNAAKKAHQNVIDTGVYDLITRAPPPENIEPPQLEAEPEHDVENDHSQSPELDEEQMERDEEERALENANRQMVFDHDSKQSVDQSHEQLQTTHSSQKTDVRPSKPPEHPQQQSNENETPPQTCPPVFNQKPSLAPQHDTSPQTPEHSEQNTVQNSNHNTLRLFEQPRPLNPLGMVDDEADEQDAEGDAINEDDHELDKAVESDAELDGIDHDQHSPSAKDKHTLAQFHRQWQLDKDKNDLTVAANGGVVDDIDEAVDLTDLLQKEAQRVDDDQDEHNAGASGTANTSNEAHETAHHSERYMELMFQRDDSRSKVVDDIEEDSDHDQKREKARALWKARQKAKAMRQQDTDSLSRFDLFDDQSVSRSADIRQKLEKACRRVSSKPLQNEVNKKRKNPWSTDSTLSDWEKRRKSVLSVAVKKRKGVPVSNWSFAVHGHQDKTSKKNVRQSNPSLGASFVHSRSRSRHVPVKEAHSTASLPPRKVSQASSRGPTSFKGLLTLLGKSAQTAE
eukprot:TRINITY_DN13351_c0_g1_i6.p4 TRINITY_DN13351_c0_g1~~TRINITY_DN13351_c0_g1_i6.p4  ORF type:complete len:575 (+),score=122.78 TRINITY_DN13351_c0_g1_i6:28-1725(+)